MGANRRWTRLGQAGIAGIVMAGLLADLAAGAMLPTGHMLSSRPKGPAREDLPLRTSTSPYRTPTKIAYGLVKPADYSIGAKHIARVSSHSIPSHSIHSQIESNTPGHVKLTSKRPAKSVPRRSNRHAVSPICSAFVAACPVALRDLRRVVTPQPQFSSVFQGQRYRFSSAEAQAKFDAKPQRYAPARGGIDVVLAAGGQADQSGSLKFASFYQNRLYLFQSQRTADAFQKNPAQFANVP